MTKRYRKNVGMVVFNAKGEVLVGDRLNFPGSWQFPQGGVDNGENIKNAALRELYEEVGINDGKIIYEHDEWISYDFPEEIRQSGRFKEFHGQKQKWFLIFWDQDAGNCKLDIHEREFNGVKFIPLSSCLETVVKFKREVYETIIKHFGPIIADYIKERK